MGQVGTCSPGDVYVISDATEWEQWDLVAVSPIVMLLDCNSCLLPSWAVSSFCLGYQLPPLLLAATLTVVGNSFSWS